MQGRKRERRRKDEEGNNRGRRREVGFSFSKKQKPDRVGLERHDVLHHL